MLSILIPTFNYPCKTLVKQLVREVEVTGLPCEIIVADDCSTSKEILLENQKISSFPNTTFIQCPFNMGRAKVRNFLASKAKGEWLLFIDSDASYQKEGFLSTYFFYLNQAEVLYGGIATFTTLPSPQKSLRFYYEKKYFTLSSKRKHHSSPYQSFSSFNFAIKKEVFMKLLFNEECVQYGYEDVLFGLKLQQNGIKILSIDNPLIHTGLDTNKEFIIKTQKALQSLASFPEEIQQQIKISNYFLSFYQKWHTRFLLKGLTFLLPFFYLNLISHSPSILIFQLYKLGYFSKIKLQSEPL